MDSFLKSITESSLKNLVLSQFPFPVWIKDSNLNMVFINSAYTKLTGITPDEYYGKSDFEVHPFEAATIYKKHDTMVVENNKPVFEYEPFGENEYPVVKFQYIHTDGSRGIAGIMLMDDMFKKNIQIQE